MNETLVKYLAGLLDADGSLSLTFRCDPYGKPIYYVGLMLRITAADAVDHHRFVENLPNTTGMGTTSRYGANKQFATWTVSKRSDLEMLLPRLIKHMVIKAQHWQWLLDLWRRERNGKRSGWTCAEDERQELAESAKASRRTRVGPIHPKNHPTWAWLAGYLDGDGHYSMNGYSTSYTKGDGNVSRYQHVSIRVGAVAHKNDRLVLDFLHKAFGGSIREHGQSKDVLVWARNMGPGDRSFALRFLPHLAKHSRLKRKKIDQIIAFHSQQQRLSVSGTIGVSDSLNGSSAV